MRGSGWFMACVPALGAGIALGFFLVGARHAVQGVREPASSESAFRAAAAPERPLPEPPVREAALPAVSLPAAGQPASETAPAEFRVKLIGTVAGASPDKAAVFEHGGKTTVGLIGEQIEGARIEEIFPQRVRLELNGRTLYLDVEEGSAAQGVSDFEPAMSAHPSPIVSSSETGESPRRMSMNPDEALAELDGSAEFSGGEDGAEAGLQVGQVAGASRIARLGLRAGDRILDIDGVPLLSREQGMLLLAGAVYSEGGTAVVTVRRSDGTNERLSIGNGERIDSSGP